MRSRRRLLFFGALAILGLTLFLALRRVPRAYVLASLPDSPLKTALETPVHRVAIKNPTVRRIVDAAKAQIGDSYNASYKVISYPNGDVPTGSGACTDVVIRAFRGADIDLQQLIHDDMKAHFNVYPNTWKLGRTDTNIDHRRVPNHIIFFKRFGESLLTDISGTALTTWQPGDIVEWKLEGGKWHTGVISDGIGPRGLPLVVHNGWKCIEQDALDAWPIAAHFRYPKRPD